MWTWWRVALGGRHVAFRHLNGLFSVHLKEVEGGSDSPALRWGVRGFRGCDSSSSISCRTGPVKDWTVEELNQWRTPSLWWINHFHKTTDVFNGQPRGNKIMNQVWIRKLTCDTETVCHKERGGVSDFSHSYANFLCQCDSILTKKMCHCLGQSLAFSSKEWRRRSRRRRSILLLRCSFSPIWSQMALVQFQHSEGSTVQRLTNTC